MNSSFKNELFCIKNIDTNMMTCTVSSESAKESDVDDLTNVLESYFERKKEFVIIYDVNLMSSVPFKFIKKLSLWTVKNEENIKKYHKYVIYVMKNTMPRIMLNTLFALRKPVFPYSVVEHIVLANELSKKIVLDLKIPE